LSSSILFFAGGFDITLILAMETDLSL